MPPRNSQEEWYESKKTLTSVDTDGSGTIDTGGGSNPVMDELRYIEDAAHASAQAAGGYVANVTSVTNDNEVVVEIRESAGSNSEMSLVTGSNGVTDVHIKAEGR